MSQGKNKAVENFWRGGALSGYSRAGGQLSGPTEVVLFPVEDERMWKLQGFGLGFGVIAQVFGSRPQRVASGIAHPSKCAKGGPPATNLRNFA
jgi:hypothetical protein